MSNLYLNEDQLESVGGPRTLWGEQQDRETAYEARIKVLEAELHVMLGVVDAARAVDATHKGVQGPQIMRLRAAIEAYDCHNVG